MTTTALVPTFIPRPVTSVASTSIDATEALGDQIAALAMQLHAATYELLVLQRGAISYAKVRALTRVATPGNETRLLSFAQAGTAAQVERLVRAWRRVDDATATAEAEARHLHRHLSTWTDDDGMVVIRGRLTPELGAVVQRALDAACDRLRREGQTAPSAGTAAEEVTQAQRRADALGLLAEAALSADLDRGSAGDRYQVVLHIDAATDVAAGEASGVPAGEGRSGTLEVDHGAVDVSAEVSRRISCDASLVPMRHADDGAVLDVGRKTRTVPPSIRRALLPATERAGSPAAPRAAATRITSSTGWTAARPGSTTWSCCAGGITARFTRAWSTCASVRTARSHSSAPMERSWRQCRGRRRNSSGSSRDHCLPRISPRGTARRSTSLTRWRCSTRRALARLKAGPGCSQYSPGSGGKLSRRPTRLDDCGVSATVLWIEKSLPMTQLRGEFQEFGWGDVNEPGPQTEDSIERGFRMREPVDDEQGRSDGLDPDNVGDIADEGPGHRG